MTSTLPDSQAPEYTSSGACGAPRPRMRGADADHGPSYEAWRCGLCGVYKVVPSLARDCEQRHLESP